MARPAAAPSGALPPPLQTDAALLQRAYDAAWSGLRAHRHLLPGSDLEQAQRPILGEGPAYAGARLDFGPHAGLLVGLHLAEPHAAHDAHRIFFTHQRDDGYLPCAVGADGPEDGQTRCVVPIATTALEAFEYWGDRSFLEQAYDACVRYDGWLVRYRDTRSTGLVEAFCAGDVGQEGSPRFAGLPERCPDGDARVCSTTGKLPFVAPDLSASVYGGRVALSRMARLLGRSAESVAWGERAEETRRRLLEVCYSPEDEAFFDVDRDGQFVYVVGDTVTNVLGSHAPSQPLFDRIWHRHLNDPDALWPPYPFPSVAANDPSFAHDLPAGAWNGASQALTALRAPRWMPHYGRSAAMTHLMEQWLSALSAAGMDFPAQIHPWTGAPIVGAAASTAAMLAVLDFTSRMYGARVRPNGLVEWNCQIPAGASHCVYAHALPRGGRADIVHEGDQSRLIHNGKLLATITGACRLITNVIGRPVRLIGSAPSPTEVVLEVPGNVPVAWSVLPDQAIPIEG
jgi:hypothetical protein